MLTTLLLLVSLALGGDLQLGYTPSPGLGESPAVLVTPPRALAEITVVVEAGGRTYEFSEHGVAAGQQLRFSWDRDPSVTTASAWITAVFADNSTEELHVPLEYTYGGALTVDLSHAVADVKRRVLEVDVTAPVERAEVKVYGAHRELLREDVVELGAGPGRIEVPWIGRPSQTVLLDITLHSATGWTGFTYSPWFLDVPHNDVLFESNQAVILPEEEPKLTETLTELAGVLDMYGSVVPVKLYIAGCTDTVGSAGHNQDLSRRRALAIASWLREHGYGAPIFYHGFGEDLLAVETSDEVDAAANRRALYIVAANPPPPGSGIPQVRWTQL